MQRAKEIVVSGIRPTGFLHLGNYFGAMRNYVRMQEEYDCYFFVADWHSLTTHPDTTQLREGPLLIINVDQNKFAEKDEDLGKIISRIDSDLYGLF